jgi:hypothetical protein
VTFLETFLLPADLTSNPLEHSHHGRTDLR